MAWASDPLEAGRLRLTWRPAASYGAFSGDGHAARVLDGAGGLACRCIDGPPSHMMEREPNGARGSRPRR
ncbi:hypothetical protein GCM10010276_05500 [Streptomyces longisporus]|uniref:Uncharacterized protein n=1 Tax=Streptomyces longisporus TaxID=1948 RepID=A0ABN3KWP8_STRLO